MMGTTLDLDDLVADCPEAKAELAELRAEVCRLRDERARILDEAAERGVAWLKTLHHEPEVGLPWSGKIRRMQDLQVQTLRAAIKGAAHE